VNQTVIEPGAKLGVLGGGQLGAMFARAAQRMGFQIAVWDPDPDAPAHRIAQYSFPRPFDDQQTRDKFSHLVRVVTYEWENVPASLCRALEQDKPVRPSSAILDIIQDRITQKAYLKAQNFPISQFSPVTSLDQLDDAITRIGCSVICKTATAGYDGKGQERS
jgi:5-(carboxyamino)imidazole ribonucleotide synthase